MCVLVTAQADISQVAQLDCESTVTAIMRQLLCEGNVGNSGTNGRASGGAPGPG